MKIPISAPHLAGNEEAYLLDAFRSSWISSTGHYVNRFESLYGSLTGTNPCAFAPTGTVALHLALLALGVQPGDEVIVPAFTYVATANAVKYVGAEPVLVDVDPATWCIDATKIEAAITAKTRGILPVHLYGHPADMDEITRIASAYKLWVVEDAAEAHFATYKGRTVGSLSTIATFSFYGNKILTSGEGGALTYNGADRDRLVRMLRSQGMDPDRRYFHPMIGYNYRLTNLACALLCAQIERRGELLARRREIVAMYERLLRPIPGLAFQPVAEWAVPTPWLFCVTVDESEFGISRDALASQLDAREIETRPFFVPLHLMPPYHDKARAGQFAVSERLGSTGLNLPTFVGLGNEQIEHICVAIADIQRAANRRRKI